MNRFLVLFSLLLISCAYTKSPEHIQDATNCKVSAYNICGRQTIQSDCMRAAQRECMYWTGYRLKKGKLVKSNSCAKSE